MQSALYRTAVGLYFLWLVATVLFIAGRYTPFPSVPFARTVVGAGAAVFALFGAVKLIHDGYLRVAGS